MKWEISIVLLPILFVISDTTTVELTQEWIPDLGWAITCSWTFTPNDKLQAVSMNKDNQLFTIYRPASNGPRNVKVWSLPDYQMRMECREETSKCVVTVEPVQPPRNDLGFACEVSGEGPKFLTNEKTLVVEAIVAPTDAELTVTRAAEQSRPVLNCSSSGIPAPKLVWTVGDDEVQVPGIFHGSQSWNATSKLWYVWSTYTPTSDQTLPVVCTPKVTKGGRQIDGKPALYNSALYIGNRGIFDATKLLLAMLTVVLLR